MMSSGVREPLLAEHHGGEASPVRSNSPVATSHTGDMQGGRADTIGTAHQLNQLDILNSGQNQEHDAHRDVRISRTGAGHEGDAGDHLERVNTDHAMRDSSNEEATTPSPVQRNGRRADCMDADDECGSSTSGLDTSTTDDLDDAMIPHNRSARTSQPAEGAWDARAMDELEAKVWRCGILSCLTACAFALLRVLAKLTYLSALKVHHAINGNLQEP